MRRSTTENERILYARMIASCNVLDAQERVRRYDKGFDLKLMARGPHSVALGGLKSRGEIMNYKLRKGSNPVDVRGVCSPHHLRNVCWLLSSFPTCERIPTRQRNTKTKSS